MVGEPVAHQGLALALLDFRSAEDRQTLLQPLEA